MRSFHFLWSSCLSNPPTSSPAPAWPPKYTLFASDRRHCPAKQQGRSCLPSRDLAEETAHSGEWNAIEERKRGRRINLDRGNGSPDRKKPVRSLGTAPNMVPSIA